jgi:hypothetical protein
MGLDSADREAELVGDLLIGQVSGDEGPHLTLPWRDLGRPRCAGRHREQYRARPGAAVTATRLGSYDLPPPSPATPRGIRGGHGCDAARRPAGWMMEAERRCRRRPDRLPHDPTGEPS